jgi:hypothetical protein
MIPYLALLLDIAINTATIPSEWETAIMVPVYRGGDRALISNNRPVSLTSVVTKQMEHVVASHLGEFWNRKEWLFKGQHGLQPGYSWESPVITVCQDIADSLDNGVRADAIIMDLSMAFDFVQ